MSDKAKTLFPTNLPEREWSQFGAAGFDAPVSGLIHRGSNPPACGVPLGGIDTGCLDIEARGLLGYATIFNSLVPRRGPINTPFLGLSVDRQTWIMTTLPLTWREGMSWQDLYNGGTFNAARTASEIHYWGHYPVADMEFETDAPVAVSLRSWSPFIPGDTRDSMIPGAVFEVHLRNDSDSKQGCTLAFSFPGPSEEEAGTTSFQRDELVGNRIKGVSVSSQQASYVLGIAHEGDVRTGGALGVDGEAWATISRALPYVSEGAGTSVAADFEMEPGEERTVRFILSWHAPQWRGGGTMTSGGNAYRHMYAKHYPDARAVADDLTLRHESLLRRVLAWQAEVYGEDTMPVWLRDSLVNVLHLITETSVWAQAESPVGDWCDPEDGVFGMNEAPRTCPQIECIPCSYYGNLPLVYFFPETALSTLRAYKAYQYPTGAAPWVFGGVTTGTMPYEMALPSPGYSHKPQTTLDGPCYVDMVDRVWQTTGDVDLLREFYDSVKANTIFTMNMRPDSGDAGIVSMPTDNAAQDWFESCDLFGIVPHIGGAHLAQLRMAQRMAEAMDDTEFADQCAAWIEGGSAVMEKEAWAGTHYMLFHEVETGKKSDVVMGYTLDGEWMARFHGLPGVFQADRVDATLDTIAKTCGAVTPSGIATFAAPAGVEIDPEVWDPGYWGTQGVHPPGTMQASMVYMYNGRIEEGLEFIRRAVNDIVQKSWYWDWPVCIEGTEPRIGADYYQNLMLWSVPAVLAGQDLTGPTRDDGLVERMIAAGRE
jgi:non-lysosomal glucosylceramidase